MERIVDFNGRTRQIEGLLIKALWPPAAIFVLHVMLLVVIHAYSYMPQLDVPMHFFGGIAVAFTFWTLSSLLPLRPLARPVGVSLRGLLAFSLTCTLAMFWEFAEYAGGFVLGVTLAGSYLDTMQDMFLGMLGGFLFSLVSVITAWRVPR